jgi:hypothetical protein
VRQLGYEPEYHGDRIELRNLITPWERVKPPSSGFEGEGFPVRRAFDLRALDPFVHMDQMGEVDYAPGEPRHKAPDRGIGARSGCEQLQRPPERHPRQRRHGRPSRPALRLPVWPPRHP